MNDTTNGAAPSDDGIQTVTIQGIEFTAPAPYSEGHVLTVAEAATLNQTLGENLRNNFAKRVKDAKDKAAGGALPDDVIASLKGEFESYSNEYEFAGKRSPRVTADPVTREARKIAKSLVVEALKARNMDIKTLADGKMDELISTLLEKKPDIRAEAQRRIDAAKAVAANALGDDMLAGLTA